MNRSSPDRQYRNRPVFLAWPHAFGFGGGRGGFAGGFGRIDGAGKRRVEGSGPARRKLRGFSTSARASSAISWIESCVKLRPRTRQTFPNNFAYYSPPVRQLRSLCPQEIRSSNVCATRLRMPISRSSSAASTLRAWSSVASRYEFRFSRPDI